MVSRKNTVINLKSEQKEYLISEIKRYFYDERNEKIGDLAAMLFLDFITEKLAPVYFNCGVEESYKYMSKHLEDVLGIQL